MGADMMGRDVFSRMIHGARISLAVALGATFLGSGFGAALGLASGYVGGWFDLLVQRVAEVMQSLPLLVMALVQGVGTLAALTLCTDRTRPCAARCRASRR